MIAEALKKALLQAAIQGKLTEQLPEDGDARDLLKEIQKERARLIKEGKIKKEKPLPEIKEDEIPFDIPENWVWVRLGDYIDFTIGKTPSRGESSYWGRDIPWVSISDMNDQPEIHITKEKISNKALNKVFNGKIVPKGTLLMSFKLTIGRMSFLGIDALHNEAIISINPIIRNPIVDKFLYKVLPFFAQAGETKGAIKGETLNSSSIRRLLFPLAPLSEQDRILKKLDLLLLEIEALKAEESKLDNLEKTFPGKIRASILQAAIQGKLTEQLPEDGDSRDLLKEIQKEKARLIKEGKIKKEKPLPEIKEDEIPFDIPENWVWVRLGDIGTWSAGATPLKSNRSYYDDGTIPWLKTGDLNDSLILEIPEFVTEKALKETSLKLQPKGTVLIAMYGATIGKLGLLEIEATTNQACCGCNPLAGVFNFYLFYFLMSHKQDFINQGAGGAQPNISREKIVGNLIPLPPYSEQKRIVEKLEELLPLCASVDASIL